jgi:hypothetical protein
MIAMDQILQFDLCPPDPESISERYLAAALTSAEAAAFESHFIGCPRCSERLQFTPQFVSAVQRATERLRATTLSN